ncbi:pilus assembly protein [Izhakiella australiensis]|uniref:Pilus assembly protein n=1 Tax=Izhakiella australiensis TaxID=1926881 RepID=A0A1S8YQE0_9GAMM|nr:fimbria/pilus periplasmic chaperone [Izhakiella australiensis]OON40996.1 pilus assembly protein [Izhakiella australiensis]
MKILSHIIAVLAGSLIVTGNLQAASQPVKAETQSFSLKTGASRIIYRPGSAGASLSVANPQSFPMLVQSQVLMENQTDAAPFVVTPPLFRLDAQQQNRLRVVSTGNVAQGDRESLYWLCMTGIPPSVDQEWSRERMKQSEAKVLVQVRVKSCIKLLVRPAALKGSVTEAAASLTWQRQGNQLRAHNATPYYANLKKIAVGNQPMNTPGFIAPFSSKTFPLMPGASGDVRWAVITDNGGESREYRASLK